MALPKILEGIVTLEELNAGLKEIDEAEAAVEIAQRAGFPVEDFRVRLRDSKERFNKSKQAFFPGQ